MPLSRQKFPEGMSINQYIEQMKINKQPFIDIFENVEVPARESTWFQEFSEMLKLAVFTADWCGDALSTTPSILKLAEKSAKFDIKIFNRDEELHLTNSFLPEHRAGTVPIFVVYDLGMNELARFIETAIALVPEIDDMDNNIDKALVAEDVEDVGRVRRLRRTPFRVAHAAIWSKIIITEFLNIVTEGIRLDAAERPAVGGTKWPL